LGAGTLLVCLSQCAIPFCTLSLSKQFSVKIEKIEDDKDEDVEIHFLSPSPSKAGLLQYTPSQVPTIIPQKQGSDLQPGEDILPLKYSLRRSTHETRVSYREGNIYEEDCHPTDVLRCPEW